MTKEEIEAIVDTAAKKAATEAVKDTLLLMGVKMDDAESIIRMQQDMKHLRESREGKEEFIKKSKSALMAVFITGTIALLVKGFWAEVVAMITGGG